MARILTLLLFLFSFQGASTEMSIGTIVNSSGAAVLLHGQKVLPPVAGTVLYANDIVRTEKGGTARLRLTDGSTLTLNEDTELRVTAHNVDTQQTSVELLHGHVFSQNTPVTKAGGRFLIRTPTAIVVALGTTFEVQTVAPSGGTATSSTTQIALQENGQPIAGADVALALANMNKVSLGKTDEKGNTNSAATSVLDLANGNATANTTGLNLANLGKVPLHAEVDECEDGTKQVYLVGADGTLPPPRKNCKRKRLDGVFFWGKPQRVMLDVTRGTSVATDLTGAVSTVTTASTTGATSSAPMAPKSLSDIPSAVTPSPNTPVSLASYTDVGFTAVTGLDHFVGVTNIDPQIPGVTYLLPGQGTIVGRGQPPESATSEIDKDSWQKVLEKNWRSDAQHVSELEHGSHAAEYDGSGRPCQPGYVVNGETVSGQPNYHYKITGLGTSTGNALQLTVTNDGNCAVYFLVTDGVIFHPKGFTERVVTGFLLGGVPSMKDFQKMISMGGFMRIAPASALGAGPAAPTGGEASMPLRSYCVELHKLAPHPKTEYRFGDEADQKELGPNRPIVDRTFSLVQTGKLQLPPDHQLDNVIQWSLWSKIEGMDQKKFHEEFMKLVQKNAEIQKRKWDKPAEKQAEASGQQLWRLVQTVLH
jgi:FecR protein